MRKLIIMLTTVAVLVIAGVGVYSLLSSKDSSLPSQLATKERSIETDAKDKKASQTIKDEELEGELVGSFPKDQIPLYSSTITSSLGRMEEYLEKAVWNVAMTSTDAFVDVDASIRSAFTSNGWKIVSDSKSLYGGVMLVAHSDNYIVTITYDDMGDSKVDINYGVSEK